MRGSNLYDRAGQVDIDRLSRTDPQYHWMLANSSLIHNVYILGRSPSYGLNGRIFRRIFGWLSVSWVSLALLRAVGVIEAFSWWWRAGLHESPPNSLFSLFVGFGAGSEGQMWRKFLAEEGVAAIRLDQTDPSTFGMLHRPMLMNLLATVWRKAGEAFNFIRNSDCESIFPYRKEFLTFTCLRVGQYAFFLEWWNDMKARQIVKAVFISPDTPAFACLDSGFRAVEFIQHGCLRRSDLMPKFPVLQLMTEEEEAYLKRLLPDSTFSLILPESHITEHNKLLLVASIYDGSYYQKSVDLHSLEEVFSWAESQGIAVKIRPHPCEDPVFWRSHFPSAEVDTSDASFEDALLRLRPLIVLSWFSTSLIDALMRGVVPVSISSTDCQHVQDMIFPLHSHCLRWPEQKVLLDDLAGGRVEVSEIISELSAVRSGAQYTFRDDSVKDRVLRSNQNIIDGSHE